MRRAPEARALIVQTVQSRGPIRTAHLVEHVIETMGLKRSDDRAVRQLIQQCREAGEVKYTKLDREFFIVAPDWQETMESILLRIDGRVVLDKDTGGLDWRGTVDNQGRAVIYSGTFGSLLVRRVLFDRYREAKGRAPLDRYETPVPTCHCDGHCVEPTHMRVRKHAEVLSTIKRDVSYCEAMAKHRRAGSRFNEAMIADIRSRAGQRIADIQKDYPGASSSLLSAILRGKIWKDYTAAKAVTPFTGLGARNPS